MPADGQQWVQRPHSPSCLQIAKKQIFLISFLIIKLFMVSLLLLLAYSDILQSAEVLCGERQRQEQHFERKHAFYSASRIRTLVNKATIGSEVLFF